MMDENCADDDVCCGKQDAPPHELRVCQCYAPTCTNYLCAVCGVAVAWHKNLMIVNPTISGRFCNDCVNIEAAYHGLSVEEMHACRSRLRIRRVAQSSIRLSLRDHRVAHPVFAHVVLQDLQRVSQPRFQDKALRPERVIVGPPSQPYLERGEACWCHRAKDCDGNHEFHNITVHNISMFSSTGGPPAVAGVRVMALGPDEISSACIALLMRGNKPTIPEVRPLVDAYRSLPGNGAGGSLHIVLDDGNVGDRNVQFCAQEAQDRGDEPGGKLSRVLLRMSKTQRKKLST